MRITDLLLPEAVQLHACPSDKSAVIDLLADLHERAGNISDKEGYKKEIWAREALDSTAVGDGVAVPHARCAAVKRASLAAVTVPDGLDYDSPDGEPSRLFSMIAAPEGGGDIHMDMLAAGTIDKRPMMAQAPDNFLQLSHFGILQFRAYHLG